MKNLNTYRLMLDCNYNLYDEEKSLLGNLYVCV